MILGFLGKGGSGKSTLATAVTNYLQNDEKNTILAIDADYNMDLMHNLGVSDDISYLGSHAKIEIKNTLNVDQNKFYADIVLDDSNLQKLSISPQDNFTKQFSTKIHENLHLMAVGPHSPDVLHDKMCSHGLSAVLKAYLPLLDLKDNEYVIVDEKAGVDSVGTGIPTGFSMAIIVAEATVYGVKAAKQISELLENHYKVPFGYVINKVKKDTNLEAITKELKKNIICHIPFWESIDNEYTEQIIRYAQDRISQNGDRRYGQSTAKFIFNKKYNTME